MKIVVGSESALKLRAVTTALEAVGIMDAVEGVPAQSGISDQPVGMDEMKQGAKTRAANACEASPGADFYIGIENGLVQHDGNWFDPVCIFISTKEGEEATSFGPFFPIPEWIVDRTFDQESELGEVIQDLAEGGEKDPMKYLSHDTVPREDLLIMAIHCALMPLLNKDRYEKH